MSLLKTGNLDVLLDAGFRRHEVIASNLANVNTPGYKAARLRFSDELSGLLRKVHEPTVGGEAHTEVYRPGGNGGTNDVSLEREAARLSRNSLRVRQYLSVLNFKIRRMKAALRTT